MTTSSTGAARSITTASRIAALAPVLFASAMPWVSGVLDNVDSGRTGFTLFELEQLRYDRPGALTALSIGGCLAILVAWACAVWVRPSRRAAALLLVLSIAGPLALHAITRGYVDPDNDVEAEPALWLTTIWLPVVGLTAWWAGRAVRGAGR